MGGEIQEPVSPLDGLPSIPVLVATCLFGFALSFILTLTFRTITESEFPQRGPDSNIKHDSDSNPVATLSKSKKNV